MADDFRRSWRIARQHKIPKSVWADALELSRYRADNLAAGRANPTPDEYTRLTKRRISTFVRYEDVDGQTHGFFIGRGYTFDDLVASGALEEVAQERGDEAKYRPFKRWSYLREAFPNNPSQVNIYAVNRSFRHQLRASSQRRVGPPR